MKTVVGIALLFLVIGMSGLAFNTHPVQAGGTIYIRADGTVDPSTAPIQRDGDYYTLMGNITSDADGIRIEKNDVTVDGAGYTVEGSGAANTMGIRLIERTNVIIRSFKIKNFSNGVYLYFCSNCNITENTATNNTFGIDLVCSSGCSVQKNTVANNTDGIHLVSSSNCSFWWNNATNNTGCGVYLSYSSYDSFQGNTVMNNECGIHSGGGSSNCIFQENKVANNSGHSINLQGSSQCIQGNLVANNGYGIWLSSTHFSIQENNVTNNGREGIRLDFSRNGSIQRNIIIGSTYGIYLGSSSNYNSIQENTLSDNIYGIYLSWASNNTVFHNNFSNNNQQAYVERSANVWDDGYPSGGNYWSDYTGVDSYNGPLQNQTGSDGIGDSPHIIDANNVDHYPLMGMFSDFNATSEHHVQTVCNSTISNFQFNSTAIIFNVTGENDTTGFCRICIPIALMNAIYKVFVNGTEVSYNLLPCSNETYSYLYFNYTHSTQEVIIIPEYPSFLILSLFMMATLLAVLVYRRKRSV